MATFVKQLPIVPSASCAPYWRVISVGTVKAVERLNQGVQIVVVGGVNRKGLFPLAVGSK